MTRTSTFLAGQSCRSALNFLVAPPYRRREEFFPAPSKKSRRSILGIQRAQRGGDNRLGTDAPHAAEIYGAVAPETR